ncbi:DUF2326 domain-containing protein [Clostridium sp. BJN0001]|uniref:DUF2326 domain-containing protein n=1 Tax=Clostridium sp. BJN0001 TaxID=2930219 RepID=UPI001FD524B2|nr:DUF2326 domain-containing protein [Clostridium sp. BJN0001]
MYLNKLYSNKESFNNIEFLPNDINIILGKKTTSELGKSVNGVGKTLSLKIIDFCLGSSINSKDNISKLKGWEFYLDFTSNKNRHTIQRNVNNKNYVFLDHEEEKVKDFNKYMGKLFFNIKTESNLLSFRNLISRFLRIPKKGYLSWNICKDKEQQETALICNSLLLGINTDLIKKKTELKNKINELNSNKKIIKNNEDIKEIIKGTDIGVNIKSLTKEIDTLKLKLKSFQISEEYNNIKTELEKFKYKKNDIINEIQLNKNLIGEIDESLNTKIDISAEQVFNLYEEAKVILNSQIKKTIEQVSEFHEKLLKNRKIRLKEDREKLKSHINILKNELNIASNKINCNIEYLKDKGTLDEYDTLRSKLSDMELRLYKIKEYDNILSEIDIKVNTIKKSMADEDLTATEYLIDYKRDEIISNIFKEYVDSIYKDEYRVSGIKVTNNTRENKIRFDIEPEIEGENSAGINNVKTFCIDMLYLFLKNNHDIEFIYHDNSIFTETDPRQVYNMLKLALKICKKSKVQYILNINYDMFENVVKISNLENDTAFANHLKKRIVANLCDDYPQNKLLGIDFK